MGDMMFALLGDAEVLPIFNTIYRDVSPSSGCTGSLAITCYHNGEGLYPINGDIIYNDVNGTEPFNGGNSTWKIGAVSISPDLNCTISNIGVVSNFSSCFGQ